LEPFFLFLSSLIASGEANRTMIGFSFSDNAAMGDVRRSSSAKNGKTQETTQEEKEEEDIQ
jgi:hypothetical protein